MRTLRYFLFFSVILSCTGCRIPKQSSLNISTAMPSDFGHGRDSAQMPLDWKLLYADTTLVSLIDSALKNNHDLLIAFQRVEELRSQIRFHRAQQLPSLLFDASAGTRKYGEYTMDGVGNYDTRLSPNIGPDQMIPNPVPDYSLGAFSSWEIDLWGKLRNRKKAAIARFWSSEKGMHLIKTHLIAEVAKTYYQLLALDSKLQIIEDNIALQVKELRIVSIQKMAGHVTELAVKQFESQLLTGKSDKVYIEQQIVETENRLNYLLGRYPQTIKRNKHLLEKELPTLAGTGIPSQMLIARPDVQQAELDLIAANADVAAARAAFFPSITISASIGLNSFNKKMLFESPASLAYNLVGGITTPLFNRNGLISSYKGAKARQVEAYINYQKTVLNSFQEVHGLLHNIQNLSNLYELKNQEIGLLTSAIRSWGDLFVSGRATYLEVIISRKNMLQAKIEQINTKQNQFNSVINLYRALGGGWQ